MSETYFEIRIDNIPRALEEQVSALCFDFGAEGVSEDLQFHQPEGTVETQTIETPELSLKVFFLKPPVDGFSIELKALNSEIEFKISEQQQKDWMEEWKKGFEPFQLAEEFWVVPSWCEVPEGVEQPLFIDPGMAFGTGTHETTMLAAEALCKHREQIVDKTVLDVGTGTGILAILCEKLGAKKVIGLEIDEMAREVGRKNLDLNKTKVCEILDKQIQDIKFDQFDWVVANIIDGVLIDLKKHLNRKTGQEGHLLVTGIVKSRENVFREEFIESLDAFDRVESLYKGEWLGYLYRRSKTSGVPTWGMPIV